MHELSICQALLQQVLGIAAHQRADRIGKITLHIGPLSGVEPDLIRVAFPVVAAGTSCEDAALEITSLAVQVFCRDCDASSIVPPNQLLCAQCGTWRVEVTSGDELLLAKVELLDITSPPHATELH